MSTPGSPHVTARQLARQRRRTAWADGWREFRKRRSGMVGLAVMVVFVALAVLAPVIADPEGLEVTKATGGVLEPPSGEFWLGTED